MTYPSNTTLLTRAQYRRELTDQWTRRKTLRRKPKFQFSSPQQKPSETGEMNLPR